MKICNNCGSQMPDEAVSCTVCGAPLTASQPQQPYQQQPYQQQPYQQPYQQQAYQPLGIIGLVLGVQARKAVPEGTPDRGKATAGMVMSIIACVWGAIAIVCTICSAVTGEASYYTILSGLL